MAIKKIKAEKNGIVEYILETEGDIALLPKKGVETYSKAFLVLDGATRTFIYYNEKIKKNEEGIWFE